MLIHARHVSISRQKAERKAEGRKQKAEVDLASAGDHAILVQLDPGIAAADLHAAARSVRALEGVLACVVGHSSLYVVFRDGRGSLVAGLVGSIELGIFGANAPETGDRRPTT